MRKKFGKLDLKNFILHLNLGNKLRTASYLMMVKKKIPFVIENETMKEALNILNSKYLGFLVLINNQGLNSGIFTDGDLKRLMQKKRKFENKKIKLFMTKNPYVVEEQTLATEVLSQMNKRKITNVCVFKSNNKRKTVGVLHIHNLVKILK